MIDGLCVISDSYLCGLGDLGYVWHEIWSVYDLKHWSLGDAAVLFVPLLQPRSLADADAQGRCLGRLVGGAGIRANGERLETRRITRLQRMD